MNSRKTIHNRSSSASLRGVFLLALLLAVSTMDSPARAMMSDEAASSSPDGMDMNLTLGNRVFRDLDNDGLYEPGAGETGIAGVLLNLYTDDSLPFGALDAGDSLLTSGTTGPGGVYGFSGLADGNYILEAAPVNFTAGAALVGLQTSTGNDDGAGNAPDPDDDVDADDNGDDVAGFGVATTPVTLSTGDEPITDGDTDPDTNLSVDLGFTCSLCLGDQIFEDTNNDGDFDSGSEVGIDDVTVNLYLDDGDGVLTGSDTFVGATDTSGGGLYEFCDLTAADYLVAIAPAEFEAGGTLEGYVSGTGNDNAMGMAPDPDDDVDDDDNGYALAGYPAATKAVTLLCASEPDKPVDGDGVDSNHTVDLGVVPSVTLGDRVFRDLDNDGLYEPGAGEAGIAGVLLKVYLDADSSGDLSVGDTLVNSGTTGGDGLYAFGGLPPGDYIVEADAINFGIGGALVDMISSSGNDDGGGDAPDPDDDVNDDDNGDEVVGFGVATDAVTLQAGTEPIDDGDADNATNLSVDLGFTCRLCVGDLIFGDLDNDGAFDSGSEAGIADVTVNLYLDDGDGVLTGSDTLLGSDETDIDGLYEFCELTAGDYLVAIDPVEFQPGGTLQGYVSSWGNDDGGAMAPDPDDDVDDDDNGYALPGFEAATKALTLRCGAEPDKADDGDGTDSNHTVDLGVYQPETLIEVEKTVYQGHDSGASCAGVEQVADVNGAAVTYCFSVTNAGSSHLDAISLDDGLLGISRGDLTQLSGSEPLAPGESLTFYYETFINGSLTNTATTSGNPTDPAGNDLPGLADPTDDDNAEVVEVAPAIQIDKTVYLDHDSGVSCQGAELVTGEVGKAITYCFLVTNTGDTHLSAIQIDDATLGIDESDMTLLGAPVTTLAPAETATWYYETTIFGDLTNVADVSGNPSDVNGVDLPGLSDPSDSDDAQVDAIAPAIQIEKTVYLGHDGGASCQGIELVQGSNAALVTYCFKVTNTGETHLDDVEIDDPDLGVDETDMVQIPGAPSPLAPGEMATWYYETTIDGDLINTATTSATPTDPAGVPVPGTDPPNDDDDASVDEIDPAVEIDKTVYLGHSAGASCVIAPDSVIGETGAAITYCFKVRNTGDTHLDTLQIDDPDLGIDETDMSLLPGSSFPLAPGAMVTWYFESTITNDLVNTASVSGNPTDPLGDDIPGVDDPSDDDTATVDQVAPPIQIDKSVYSGHDFGASCEGQELVVAENGDAITYCFKVTNIGDTHLGDIEINDGLLGIDETDMGLVGAPTFPLAPGEMAVWYYETSLAGDLTNIAQAEGNPTDLNGNDLPGVEKPSDDDTAAVDEVAPAIQIDKTVYVGHDNGAGCPGVEQISDITGIQITYCFELTNTGDTHLDPVTIVDGPLGIDESDLTLVSGGSPLAPGESATWYYETTITGDLINTALATGDPTDPAGDPLPDVDPPTDDDDAEVDEVQPGAPAIQIDKTVYLGHDAGTSCEGLEQVIGQNGKAITYCFKVTNTSPAGINLDNIQVDDASLGIDESSMTLLSGTFPLAPGEMALWYYETTISGDLVNTAMTTGDPINDQGNPIPGANPPTDEDDAEVDERLPGIEVQKTVYLGHDSGALCPGADFVSAENGDALSYCFVVTNTGDTHLDEIQIDDADLGIDETDMTPLSLTLPLAPGEMAVWYYESTVDGDLVNTASGTATPTDPNGTPLPGTDPPTDEDDAEVDEVNPDIDLQKRVDLGHSAGAGCAAAGDLATGENGTDITYCFTVTNTGDTHLDSIQVLDPDLGIDDSLMTLLPGASFPLAPGATATWYFETILDGDFMNTAAASGNPTDANGDDLPGIDDPMDDDSATVDEVAPAIEVVKTVYRGLDAGLGCPGLALISAENADAVTYCFKVTNIGDTHLDAIELDDGALGIDESDMTLLAGAGFPLAPGAMATWYYETSVAGDLTNVAVVSGNPTDPNGNDLPGVEPPIDDDTAVVDAVAPAIQIEKTVYLNHDGGASCPGVEQASGFAGTQVTYCFAVTNTGDTHLDTLQIDDVALGIDQGDMTQIGAPSFPLAPGATATWYFEATIVQDLINVADTSGTPTDPAGNPLPGIEAPTDDDSAEVDEVEPGVPAIQIDKTVYLGHDAGASCEGVELVTAEIAAAITYCFKLTNTGPAGINLDNLLIDDAALGIDESDMTLLGSPSFPLAPGEMATWYFQTNIVGDLVNTASATGDPVNDQGNPIPGVNPPVDDDTAEVDAVQPDILIEKTVYHGHDAGIMCPGGDFISGDNGDQITYCFKITNTGDTHLDSIQVDDPSLGIDQSDMTPLSLSLPLSPGSMAVWYFETTVSGDLVNIASTTGTPTDPNGNPIPGTNPPSDTDDSEVDEVVPDIEIQKSVYLGHSAGVGCVLGANAVVGENGAFITYCFKVTNTGGTYLDSIQIDDADLSIDQNDMVSLGAPSFPLAPGEMATWYFEAVIDGDFTNTASTSANPTDPNGDDLPGVDDPSDSDSADVDEVAPLIQIDKSVYSGHDSGSSCQGLELVVGENGDAVTYCYAVTNTGDTHLDTVEIDDGLLGIDETDMTLVGAPSFPLAPGETATWYYETTIDGDLTNLAVALANPTDPNGNDLPGVEKPRDNDTAEVDEVQPGILVEKTVYVNHDAGASCPGIEQVADFAGTQITFCFQVTNTGDTDLNDISISDALLGIDESDMTLLGAPGFPLAPGETATWYYEATITQDLVNVANVTGTPVDPSGDPIPNVDPPTDDDDADVDEVQPETPAIQLDKTVYLGHDSGVSCEGLELVTGENGKPITYCFKVTNTSPAGINLDQLQIDDPGLGIDETDMTLVGAPSFPLAPGEMAVWYYETTIDGDLVNTAMVSADPINDQGNPIPGVNPPNDDDDAEVDEVAPALEVEKSVYVGHDAGSLCPGGDLVTDLAGTPVTYCFRVTNTGDTHMSDIQLDDANLGIDETDMTALSVILPLAPGETAVWYYETSLVGDLVNLVAVVATPTDPNGDPLPGTDPEGGDDDAEVDAVSPSIDLSKTVYLGHDAGAGCAGSDFEMGLAGAAVTYCFAATNTGDTWLDPVGLIDSDLGITELGMVLLSGATPLAPGATMVWYYETTISGSLVNVADVMGNPATNQGADLSGMEDVTDRDDAEVAQLDPTLTIGNQIFFDVDNDGVFEPLDGEFGIGGVEIELYRDADADELLTGADALIGSTISSPDGSYIFADLEAGKYFVVVVESNFDAGGLLDGVVSSSGNDVAGSAPDPDDDVDDDDNGGPVLGFGVATKAVMLMAGGEPIDDGDDANGNLTVDLGFRLREEPTGARLTQMKAEAGPDGVVLIWETATELGLVGFNVLRSSRPGGDFESVNRLMIPSEGSGSRGALYRYTDEAAAGTWFYKIEVIAFDGGTERYGPVSAIVLGPAFRLYLPSLSASVLSRTTR